MRPTRRLPHNGRSLVELLVSLGVFAIMSIALAQAFVATKTYFHRVELQSELESEFMIGLGSLSNELTETFPGSVLWEADVPALSFPLPRSPDGVLLANHSSGSTLRFQTLVSYQIAGPQQELRRYVDYLPAPLNSPPNLLRLSPPRNATYFTGSPYRVLARGVTDFDLTAIRLHPTTSVEEIVTDFARASLFRIELRLEKEAHGKTYALSTLVDIVARN